jgi:DNA-directed RNA polymerase specialized sigma subunit
MHGVILGLGDAVYGGPGPDKLAEDREHGELWLASLTGQELTCVELMTDGTYTQVEIAFIMNISTTRVCQILKRARAKWHEVS